MGSVTSKVRAADERRAAEATRDALAVLMLDARLGPVIAGLDPKAAAQALAALTASGVTVSDETRGFLAAASADAATAAAGGWKASERDAHLALNAVYAGAHPRRHNPTRDFEGKRTCCPYHRADGLTGRSCGGDLPRLGVGDTEAEHARLFCACGALALVRESDGSDVYCGRCASERLSAYAGTIRVVRDV